MKKSLLMLTMLVVALFAFGGCGGGGDSPTPGPTTELWKLDSATHVDSNNETTVLDYMIGTSDPAQFKVQVNSLSGGKYKIVINGDVAVKLTWKNDAGPLRGRFGFDIYNLSFTKVGPGEKYVADKPNSQNLDVTCELLNSEWKITQIGIQHLKYVLKRAQ